jgi:hypothetical protein
MRQEVIDFDGALGRDAGIAQAVEHAEAVVPAWRDRAYAMLVRYAAAHPRYEFVAPDVREWAAEHGLPSASAFAWGPVFRRGARDGIIERAGFTTYGDETMHAQTVTLWRAA